VTNMSTMPALSILALGDWPAERLHCSSSRSSLDIPADLLARIDHAWEIAAARPGVHLFDGPLCRLEKFHDDDAGLHLSLSRTSYRLFMGTNGNHPQWAEQYGQQVMANPVGTSVALVSADGQLVFGRRSTAVALYPGFAHPFGGTMEPTNDGSPVDVLEEIRRELREEAGITHHDLTDLRIIALIEDLHLRQPELVYAARTSLTASEIAQRLDHHEHTACWLLPDQREAIDATLFGKETITPVLAGVLLAWGWRRFGDDWLEAHLATGQAIRR
jgi:8-oxo-dGTP pyrophosphatase MutT (NUDIX family)